jgi:CHAD domain-containing protein
MNQNNENFSDQIIDRINENFSRVNINLNLYLKDPDEKNIHDIRKSIRRAESAYMTLPKKYRKKKEIRDFIYQTKIFFKINSKIRDYDIFLKKIENYQKKNTGIYTKDIILEIQNNRKSNLRIAITTVEKIKVLEYPQIKKNNKRIQAKIKKRFTKVVENFLKKIKKNLPTIINDESKVEELHKLRKDCKRLRYILELKPTDKKDNHDDLSKSITQLENLQDILGKIHDCDAILSFFDKSKNYPETKPLMNNERKIRKDLYKEFADKYQKLI